MTKRTRASANAIIAHFERAHEDFVNVGALHPEDHDSVVTRYKAARERLAGHLMTTNVYKDVL